VEETKTISLKQGIDIMVLANKIRLHLRRQEVPIGATLVMLLAATTAALSYFYY
jgi:hypothetical protein